MHNPAFHKFSLGSWCENFSKHSYLVAKFWMTSYRLSMVITIDIILAIRTSQDLVMHGSILPVFLLFFFVVFFFISFIGHTYKRLHIIIQTKKITGYTSNGASANGTTRPMQGATPKLD